MVLAFPDGSHLALQLFIGFGFPYEGPAPLEAIANGCVFLQSRFSPPHSSLNHEFFRGKPTSREVSGGTQPPSGGLRRGPCRAWERETEAWSKGARGPVGWRRHRTPAALPAGVLAAPVRRALHRQAPRVDRGLQQLGGARGCPQGHHEDPGEPQGHRHRQRVPIFLSLGSDALLVNSHSQAGSAGVTAEPPSPACEGEEHG